MPAAQQPAPVGYLTGVTLPRGPQIASGRGPRPRSARARDRARDGGSGGPRRRARGSSTRRCRPAASRCARSAASAEHVASDTPGRRATAIARELGDALGLVPGRERRVLIGAEQQDEAVARDSAGRARAACRPCTTGPGRSISMRETVSAGIADRRRLREAQAHGRPAPAGAGRCGGMPVGTSTTRESPSCQVASWQSSRWPRCTGLQSEPSTPTRGVSVLTIRGRPPRRRSYDGLLGRQRELEALVADRDLVAGLDAGVAQRLDHAQAAELDRERAHALGRREIELVDERHDLAARDAHDAVVAHEAEDALARLRAVEQVVRELLLAGHRTARPRAPRPSTRSSAPRSSATPNARRAREAEHVRDVACSSRATTASGGRLAARRRRRRTPARAPRPRPRRPGRAC